MGATSARYVVLNPVRAGMVRSPRDWPWSNYRVTAGMEGARDWLETRATLATFAETEPEAVTRYRRFVAEGKGQPSTWEHPPTSDCRAPTMPNYVRAFVPGGTVFFTVCLLNRRQRLLTEHIADLRAVFGAAHARRAFTVDAIVVLPEHLHCLWPVPPGDAGFTARWHEIKARFSARIPTGEPLSSRRRRKGERGIWQRRFWEHVIRDPLDFERHFDYIHYNPVKHEHVRRVADWPYSSFHRCVRRGLYPLDWAAGDEVQAMSMK